jgi:hypothetical protein
MRSSKQSVSLLSNVCTWHCKFLSQICTLQRQPPRRWSSIMYFTTAAFYIEYFKHSALINLSCSVIFANLIFNLNSFSFQPVGEETDGGGNLLALEISFEIVGGNVLINGRSSLQKQPKANKVGLSFAPLH